MLRPIHGKMAVRSSGIPSPPPEYNFKQIPLVRGIDAYWKEKMAGNKEMTPSEPVGPIHMPSPSILPFVMSLGLFIAGLGFMFSTEDFSNSFMSLIFNKYIVLIVGLLITFAAMIARSCTMIMDITSKLKNWKGRVKHESR